MIAHRGRRVAAGAAFAGALLVASCSSDGGSSTAESIPVSTGASTGGPTVTTTTLAASTTLAPPATTVGPSDTSTTAAPSTTIAPDVLQSRPGTAAITVDVTGDDPARPTMSWAPVDGAVSYELAVHDAGGNPVWAWTGADTSVVLGGVERAADAEGPTLDGAGTVRVYALDAGNALVGVSAWTPVGG